MAETERTEKRFFFSGLRLENQRNRAKAPRVSGARISFVRVGAKRRMPERSRKRAHPQPKGRVQSNRSRRFVKVSMVSLPSFRFSFPGILECADLKKTVKVSLNILSVFKGLFCGRTKRKNAEYRCAVRIFTKKLCSNTALTDVREILGGTLKKKRRGKSARALFS